MSDIGRQGYSLFEAHMPMIDKRDQARAKHTSDIVAGKIKSSVPVIYHTNGLYEVVTDEEYKRFYGFDEILP